MRKGKASDEFRPDYKREDLGLGVRSKFFDSYHSGTNLVNEAEIEKLWIDEAIRRDEELDRGAARAYLVDEVLARIRACRK